MTAESYLTSYFDQDLATDLLQLAFDSLDRLVEHIHCTLYSMPLTLLKMPMMT